ncbi:MAG: murein biosynthesis integral membrane protein MurJ [Myxococcales bacterium]|nr:murein biosynthesis integral membrane protein MurJ [Myxococcales bacterium]
MSGEGGEGGEGGAGERHRLAGRTAVVGAGTLVSRMLGLARDAVLAALFPRAVTDAFFVAYAIPSALRQLFAEGPVQGAVLPVLAEQRRAGGDEGARRFFAALRGAWLLAVCVATAAGIAAAPALTDLFGVHVEDGAEAHARTVTFARWVFLCLPLAAWAALDMAALQARRRFAVAAFSPAVANVAMIVAAVALPPVLAAEGQDPALALALGAVVGAALHVVAQWPSLRRSGELARPRWEPRHPGVREVGLRILTMGVGIGVYLVNIALARRLLADTGEGGQSYFTWGFRLCAIPQGLFVIALATAALPTLSSLAAAREKDELARTFAFSMRLALFVAVPAAALFAALAGPLVVAFFQRGAFGPEAASETAAAVLALAPGIPSVAAIRQLAPVFFAQGDTRTPVLGSVANLVVFAGAALALRPVLGHAGVSAAYSLANLAQALLLFVLVRRRLVRLLLGAIARACAKTGLASAAATGAALALLAVLPAPTGLASSASALGRLVPAALGTATFGVVFVAVAWAVRSEELGALVSAARARGRS